MEAAPQAQDLVARVLPLVESRHGKAWLVGGWVRDRLLGRMTHDVDFVVPAGAVTTARLAADLLGGALVLLDVGRDTARVVLGPPGDATFLDFAGLRGPDIEADLLARDFTINAMAVEASEALAPEPPVIDPVGGRPDLARRLLRAVSADAFRDDPLRTLRGVRLSAALGFELEGQTAAWIRRDARLLDAVSRERVRDEFAQILGLPGVERSLRLLDEFCLLEQVVPELARLRAAEEGGAGDSGPLEHAFRTAGVVEALLGWLRGGPWETLGRPGEMLAAELGPYRSRLAEHVATILPGGRSVAVLLTLAALLHDVGKGAPGQGQPPPGAQLLGHDLLGASIAATVARRLCFSNAETVRLRLAVRNHMRPGELVQEAGAEPSRRAIYRFFRDAEPSGVDTILLSLADHLAARGPALDPEHWRRHLAMSGALLEAYYRRRHEILEPPMVIDGYDLIESLGLAPGPEMGELLEAIREAQAAGEVRSRQDALELARQLLAGRAPL